MMKEKIRTLIVDDEPLFRRRIRRLLGADSEIEIIGECSNGRETVGAIQTRSPDLVFLDVELPDTDGLKALEEVNKETRPVVIVVTGYPKYALRAHRIHPSGYLLKSYTDSQFFAELDGAKQEVRKKQYAAKYQAILEVVEKDSPAPPDEPLACKLSNGKTRLFFKEEIDWIKAYDKYAYLYVRKEEIWVDASINKLSEQLDRNQFWRVHRSYLVNVKGIRDIVPWEKRKASEKDQEGRHPPFLVVLYDGTEVPMSRRGYNRFIKHLAPRGDVSRRHKAFDGKTVDPG